MTGDSSGRGRGSSDIGVEPDLVVEPLSAPDTVALLTSFRHNAIPMRLIIFPLSDIIKSGNASVHCIPVLRQNMSLTIGVLPSYRTCRIPKIFIGIH